MVSRRNMNNLTRLTMRRKTADIRQLPDPSLQRPLHRGKKRTQKLIVLSSLWWSSVWRRGNDRLRLSDLPVKSLLILFLWISNRTDTALLLCWPGDSEHGSWFLWIPRLIAAPKRRPADLLMESRRPPYATPSAPKCQPAWITVSRNFGNCFSDYGWRMPKNGNFYSHSSPWGRQNLIQLSWGSIYARCGHGSCR